MRKLRMLLLRVLLSLAYRVGGGSKAAVGMGGLVRPVFGFPKRLKPDGRKSFIYYMLTHNIPVPTDEEGEELYDMPLDERFELLTDALCNDIVPKVAPMDLHGHQPGDRSGWRVFEGGMQPPKAERQEKASGIQAD